MTDADKPMKPKRERVGYGCPPERTRFKPGRSGNPRGRPKGTLNMATILERTLREPVVIEENGKRETVTKLEAAFKQLVNSAAAGDLRAIQQLSGLARLVEERSDQQPDQQAELGDDDQKVLDGILRRLSKKSYRGDEK